MNARLLPARGLYAITPDTADTVLLLARCRALLHCAHPPALLQYRNKCLPKDEQWAQARAVQVVCRAANVPFIVNDSLEMALALDADGLHLGQEDGDLAAARAALGTNRILGATCHDSCQLAQQAAAAGADYLAFGAFFPSPSKPAARRASIDVLRSAHARFAHLPLVAIGGITAENAAPLLDAGAHWLAVIGDLFDADDIAARAAHYAARFAARTCGSLAATKAATSSGGR